jgi:hypothetical protein
MASTHRRLRFHTGHIRLFSSIPIVLAVAAFGLLSPAARAQFEGVVESKSTFVDDMGKPATSTMTMYVAKDMLRIENSAVGETPASTMIYRGDKRVMWILSDEEKIYLEVPQREETPPPSSAKPSPKPKILRTGKVKTIAGYRCEQMIVKEGEMETEIWAAKGLTALAKAINKGIGGEAEKGGTDWNDEIFGMGLMPLISSTRMHGKVIEKQEVTKIELHAVPNEKFQVPAGYKKEAIGGMKAGE